MKRPPHLLVALVAAPLLAAGMLLWRSEGAMIWLTDAMRTCL